MKNRIRIFLHIFILCSFCLPAAAQEPDEPLLERFTESFQKPYFCIGGLLQVVFDYQAERTLPRNNGFRIPNAMIHFTGELDSGFGYLLRAQFRNTPSIFDAEMHYSFPGTFTVKAGLFKSPFSKAFLISPANTDCVQKSRIVGSFAPGRQVGFQISGRYLEEMLEFRAGVFNGNHIETGSNDDGAFLSMARLAFHTPRSTDPADWIVEFGLNAAGSHESRADLFGGRLPDFEGTQLLVGADMRIENHRFFFSGEGIFARFESFDGTAVEPYGFHLTTGYMLFQHVQGVFRWDVLDTRGLDAHSRYSELIFGLNAWPTRPTKFQINIVIDMFHRTLRNHQLLIKSQLAL